MNARDLFALARQGECEDEAATEARQTAAIEFEPVDNAGVIAELSEPNYSRMTRDLGISLRLSAVIVGKTKAELVEATRGVCAGCAEDDEDHPLIAMIDGLIDASERLQALRALVDAALARSVTAASVVALEDDPAP